MFLAVEASSQTSPRRGADRRCPRRRRPVRRTISQFGSPSPLSAKIPSSPCSARIPPSPPSTKTPLAPLTPRSLRRPSSPTEVDFYPRLPHILSSWDKLYAAVMGLPEPH